MKQGIGMATWQIAQADLNQRVGNFREPLWNTPITVIISKPVTNPTVWMRRDLFDSILGELIRPLFHSTPRMLYQWINV